MTAYVIWTAVLESYFTITVIAVIDQYIMSMTVPIIDDTVACIIFIFSRNVCQY